MSSKWPTTNLGAICKFTAGSAFKPEFQGCSAGDYPFIKVSDMNAAGNEIFINSASNYVNEIQRAAMKAKLHPVGAIVFAKIGVALTTNRRRLLTRPTIIDNNMMSATPRDGRVTSRFLYLLLTSIDFNTISAGTALPYLNVSDLERIEVSIPDTLSEQEAIARTLGDIDDKIDLNRRINQSLEAMAQAIFQSWFVDFDPVKAKIAAKAEGRDPLRAAMSAISGKADAELDALPPEQYEQLAATAALFPDEMEASELGEIPRGWGISTVGQVAEVIKGKSYSSKDLIDNTQTALVTLKSFERGGGFRMDGFKPYVGVFKPAQVVEPGELIVAYTDVTQAAELIGRPAIVVGVNKYQTLVASLDVGIVRPHLDQVSRQFLFGLFSTDAFQAHTFAHTSGTTVLHLAKEGVPSFRFARPPIDLINNFSDCADPTVAMKQSTLDQIAALRELRDALLPKLLSGELKVQHSEPEAVA